MACSGAPSVAEVRLHHRVRRRSAMAEQPPVPADVTPQQFFEQLLPMGFAAQASAGGAAPSDVTLQFHVTGSGGGDWHAKIQDGKMEVKPGSSDANFTVTLSV